jgi:hypothetical protein
LFAQELATGKSPLEASRLAGYPPGSSFGPNSRKRAGRPDIKARVAELQHRAAELAELDRGWVLAKLKSLADFNLADYLKCGEDGEFYYDLSQCSREQLSRLAEASLEHTIMARGRGDDGARLSLRKTKLKGYDKVAAISKIATIMGFEKSEVADALTGIGDKLDAAFARVETK